MYKKPIIARLTTNSTPTSYFIDDKKSFGLLEIRRHVQIFDKLQIRTSEYRGMRFFTKLLVYRSATLRHFGKAQFLVIRFRYEIRYSTADRLQAHLNSQIVFRRNISFL